MKELGRRLRLHRLKQNLPQQHVADLVGISLPTFRKIEAGVGSVEFRTPPGGAITVFVRNTAAHDMPDVQVNFNGQSQTASSPITLHAPAVEGTYNITVAKPGFETVSAVVRVQADRRLLVGGVIAGAMLIILLAYFLLTRKKKVAAPTDYSKV